MKKRFQHLLMLGAMLGLGGLLAYRILSKPAPASPTASSVQPRPAAQAAPAPASVVPAAEPASSAPTAPARPTPKISALTAPSVPLPSPAASTDHDALATKVAQAEALRVSLVRQIGSLQSANEQLQQDLGRARAAGAEIEALRQKLADAEKKLSAQVADAAGDSAAVRERAAALDGVKRRTFIVNP